MVIYCFSFGMIYYFFDRYSVFFLGLIDMKSMYDLKV